MQITETLSEGLKRAWQIVLPAADMQQRLDGRLAEVAREIRLPGFRPGRVPAALVRQRYGASIRQEVVEQAVNQSTQDLFAERGIRPAMQPHYQITSAEDGGDLAFSIQVEMLPEIQVMDLAGLELERLTVEIDEAMTDEALAGFARRSAEPQALSEPRPAVLGDIVIMDFAGTVDGEPREGMAGENMELRLGDGRLIPGFEEQLVGAQPGEARTVTVTFPADYGATELAGKEALFAVTVKEIRELVTPPIDDKLAARFGLEDLDELKIALRDQIRREHERMSRLRIKRHLLDRLEAGHDVPLPPTMVDIEFTGIWQRVQQERDAGHLDAEDMAKSEEELQAEYRRIAERRVRLGLVLAEIGRANGIQVTDEELQRAVYDEARASGRPREVIDFFQKNPQALDRLRAPIYEEKAVDFILSLARVTERQVTAAELQREAALAEAADLAESPGGHHHHEGDGHDHHHHDHDHGHHHHDHHHDHDHGQHGHDHDHHH